MTEIDYILNPCAVIRERDRQIAILRIQRNDARRMAALWKRAAKRKRRAFISLTEATLALVGGKEIEPQA